MKKKCVAFRLDEAVSPVIAILLMLVVTIIIAAVVSGFAGGLVSGQSKVPQAQISGKFSVSDGFLIKHNGGDPLPTNKINIIIRDSDQFGAGVEQQTTNVIQKTNVTDNTGLKFWAYSDGSSDVNSFNPGDIAIISSQNCTCNLLQPANAPQPWSAKEDGYTYGGSALKLPFFKTCLRNNDNIGKTFILEVVDTTSGKMIAHADVPITS